MKTIIVSVSTNYIQCTSTAEFEVEDDASEEEINELALDEVFNLIDYGWEEKDNE